MTNRPLSSLRALQQQGEAISTSHCHPEPAAKGGKAKDLFLSFILFALFLSGCATGDYRIRAGDELRVVVWKELDEKAVVRPDNKISLPLAGEISCRNKTPAVLSSELSEKYTAQTTVMVTKSHSFKDDFKELIGFVRDASVIYFLGERIKNDT